jgi:hypothetical protein
LGRPVKAQTELAHHRHKTFCHTNLELLWRSPSGQWTPHRWLNDFSRVTVIHPEKGEYSTNELDWAVAKVIKKTKVKLSGRKYRFEAANCLRVSGAS